MILRTDSSGLPIKWISAAEAAHLIVSDNVSWMLGADVVVLHGGTNNQGEQSVLTIPAVVATHGRGGERYLDKTPGLTNRALFSRDNYTCMYCGHTKETGGRSFKLTRDHIIPQSKGGPDVWSNVVTCCSRCNNKKDSLSLHQANMKLLAVPYVPNYAEGLILKNRAILLDQMDFLRPFCKQDQFTH
jgi:5-methylcytosine-specific restriction endonuclease McrA